MKHVTLILKNADPLFNPCAANIIEAGENLLAWAAEEFPSEEVVGFEVRDLNAKMARQAADENNLNSLIKR